MIEAIAGSECYCLEYCLKDGGKNGESLMFAAPIFSRDGGYYDCSSVRSSDDSEKIVITKFNRLNISKDDLTPIINHQEKTYTIGDEAPWVFIRHDGKAVADDEDALRKSIEDVFLLIFEPLSQILNKETQAWTAEWIVLKRVIANKIKDVFVELAKSQISLIGIFDKAKIDIEDFNIISDEVANVAMALKKKAPAHLVCPRNIGY